MSVTEERVVLDSEMDQKHDTAHGLVKFLSICQILRCKYGIELRTQKDTKLRRVIIKDSSLTIEVMEDKFGCAQTLIEQAFAKFLDLSRFVAISVVASRHSYDYDDYSEFSPEELAKMAFDMMEQRKRGSENELSFAQVVADSKLEGEIMYTDAAQLAYLKVMFPLGVVEGDDHIGRYYRPGCLPRVRADEIVKKFFEKENNENTTAIQKVQVASSDEVSLLHVLMNKNINSFTPDEKKRYGIGFYDVTTAGRNKLLTRVRRGVSVSGLIDYIMEEILLETNPMCENKRDWAIGVIMKRKNVFKLDGDQIILDSGA